ncbi:hypothetical protein H4I95_11339 [Botrytis cinerea]
MLTFHFASRLSASSTLSAKRNRIDITVAIICTFTSPIAHHTLYIIHKQARNHHHLPFNCLSIHKHAPQTIQPPRPSGQSKPRGRPKGTTSTSTTSKPKSTVKSAVSKQPRVSKTPTPQLEDSDSSSELEKDKNDEMEVDEESDDPFASQPTISKGKAKASTSTSASTTKPSISKAKDNGDPQSSDSELEMISPLVLLLATPPQHPRTKTPITKTSRRIRFGFRNPHNNP